MLGATTWMTAEELLDISDQLKRLLVTHEERAADPMSRPQTPYEHAWEIRDRYGYRSFDDQGCAEAFARFLEGLRKLAAPPGRGSHSQP